MALVARSCFRGIITQGNTPRLLLTKNARPVVSLIPQHGILRNIFHTSPQASQTADIDKAHGSRHWINERYLSIALLGLIPAGIMYPSPPVDWALAFVLPMHNYWGMNQVFTDYVHGETLPVVVKALWAGVSVLTVVGLAYLNYNDVGICKVIAMTLKL